MREACLGRARASRAHCFQLCFFVQGASGAAAQMEAEVRRSTLMSPLNGHSRHPPRLRRRGASGGAQAGRRSARRCDCAKGGLCAVS
jgi:hypothetical protein